MAIKNFKIGIAWTHRTGLDRFIARTSLTKKEHYQLFPLYTDSHDNSHEENLAVLPIPTQ